MLDFDQMKQEIRHFSAKIGILAGRLKKPLEYGRIVVLVAVSTFIIAFTVNLFGPLFEESKGDRYEHYNPYDLEEIEAENHEKSVFITSEALDVYANGDEKWVSNIPCDVDEIDIGALAHLARAQHWQC